LPTVKILSSGIETEGPSGPAETNYQGGNRNSAKNGEAKLKKPKQIPLITHRFSFQNEFKNTHQATLGVWF